MKHIAHTAITLTVAALLAGIISIRTPILLAFWQWWLIAIVLLIVGAAILGKREREIAEAVGRHPAGSAVVNPTGTPEQIIAPRPGEKPQKGTTAPAWLAGGIADETARKRREFGTGLGR